jgi:hypothetical protein
MPYRDQAVQREYQRRWKAQRRASWFAGKVCNHCGTGDSLELHHRNGEKESHKIWSWSRSRRDAELAKCVVLCRDCHEDEHWPHSMPRSPRLAALVADAQHLAAVREARRLHRQLPERASA